MNSAQSSRKNLKIKDRKKSAHFNRSPHCIGWLTLPCAKIRLDKLDQFEVHGGDHVAN
jgi:hypothetical protein